MSKRTRQAQKAVLAAWENEQALVQEGKGTRDWTPEQQQAILENGKAYDENGKAFEGQHMKSAEQYPEYQGDPKNIQFLTREEHFEAHDFNWQNPTNWYFDPDTKAKFHFGDGPYIPCEIISLSEPIRVSLYIQDEIQESCDIGSSEAEMEDPTEEIDPSWNSGPEPEFDSQSSNAIPLKQNATYIPEVKKVGLFERIGNVLDKGTEVVLKFAADHPVITGIALSGGAIIGHAISSGGKSNGGSNSVTSSSRSNNGNYNRGSYDITDDTDDIFDLDEPFYEEDPESVNNVERASPIEHTVRPHGQHYNTKNGRIWKEKDSYQRSRKSDEE